MRQRSNDSNGHPAPQVDGQVLDVTSFLSEHPGGELAILTFAGKDATEEFNMCLGIGKMGKGGGCKVFATQGEILVDFAGKIW